MSTMYYKLSISLRSKEYWDSERSAIVNRLVSLGEDYGIAFATTEEEGKDYHRVIIIYQYNIDRNTAYDIRDRLLDEVLSSIAMNAWKFTESKTMEEENNPKVPKPWWHLV